jgi:selenium metabolism protein YedF
VERCLYEQEVLVNKVVDCRGLACPQPVIQSRRAMAEADEVTTVVDNATAVSNVSRMAAREGFAVEVEEKDDGLYLQMRRKDDPSAESAVLPAATGGVAGPVVVLISGNGMGRGDDELGGILIRSFLHTLEEVQPLPDTIIFLNAGVKLTIEGSLVVEDLEALEERGVEILACGTCLGHFGLKDKIVVGQVSNMYSIAEALLGAGSVVAV